MDIGTVVGTNAPLGIGTAEMIWLDENSIHHSLVLEDALYYPDSPVNVISATKLGLDSSDPQLNMQTFPTHSLFTWNKGGNTKLTKYSSANLPEIPLYAASDFLPTLPIAST